MAYSRLLLLTAVLAACGSSDKNNSLSALSPAGDACPSGGGVITSTGIDDDGDGTLDQSEIDTTTTLCAADTLTRLDPIAPGAVCPNGGTSIKAGMDDDRDAILDDSEVDTSQTLCKGTIVRTTPIGPENPACLGFGGVLLELGIDDDGDDFLDDGEIDLSTVSCNGATETQPPAAPAGAAKIFLDGGDSEGGQGGASGSFTASLGPTGGGTLALFETGVVDASFTLPAHTTIPGPRQLTVSADLNVPEWAGAPAMDTVYSINNELRQYKGNVDPTSPVNPVYTSLTVAAGVKLTVNTPTVILADDLVNGGTIVRGGDTKAITLTCRTYVGLPGSKIDAVGGAGVAGGQITVNTGEDFINEGTLDSTGGAGAVGGPAGGVIVDSARNAYNRGDLLAVGGQSTGALSTGGNGARIYLGANGGRLQNSGDIRTGGASGTRQGGDGGSLELFAYPSGLRNSGDLDSSGAAPDCVAACRGGNAGNISVTSEGGLVLTSGSIKATGGTTTAPTGCGGNGAGATIGSDTANISTLGQGTTHVSGEIDLRGGSGGSAAAVPPCSAVTGGGNGGSLNVFGSPQFPLGQEVVFFGYTGVSAIGGSSGGAFQGAQGGDFRMYRSGGDYGQALGSVQNWVDVDVSGGDAKGARGGDGGSIGFSFGGSGGYASGTGLNVVRNYGDLTNDGGDGTTGGGVSGNPGYGVLLYGPEGVDNTGAIHIVGGTGSTAHGGPGEGPIYRYAIILSSDIGRVSNSAALTASGGSGAQNGGGAGEICLEGTSVVNSGPLTSTGGNAGATFPNGDGGDGWLKSFFGASTSTGTFAASAGTGGTGGTAGSLFVDVLDGRCYQYFTLD